MSVEIFLIIIILASAAALVSIRTFRAQNPKFCTRCGSELVQSVQFMGFDSKTGKKLTQTVQRCLNRSKPVTDPMYDFECSLWRY